MNRVRWSRPHEEHVSSKCGRFEICPLYMGTTRPQGYKVWDDLLKKHTIQWVDTIAQAKVDVEQFLEREEKER